MTERFFTSDHHFGHANIARLSGRPFSHGPEGVEEMNESMIDTWNSVIGPNDEVTYLGDFSMGKVQENVPLALRLNGRITLYVGNHDRCFDKKNPGHILPQWEQFYLDSGFDRLVTETVEVVPGLGLCRLSHFPSTGESFDGREDRYVEHRPVVGDERFLIHGHVHEQFRRRGREINLGIDSWGGLPVHLDELVALADGPEQVGAIRWA